MAIPQINKEQSSIDTFFTCFKKHLDTNFGRPNEDQEDVMRNEEMA